MFPIVRAGVSMPLSTWRCPILIGRLLGKNFATSSKTWSTPLVAPPTGWMPLRVVVKGQRVQIYVGTAKSAALEARKLGTVDRGMSASLVRS